MTILWILPTLVTKLEEMTGEYFGELFGEFFPPSHPCVCDTLFDIFHSCTNILKPTCRD